MKKGGDGEGREAVVRCVLRAEKTRSSSPLPFLHQPHSAPTQPVQTRPLAENRTDRERKFLIRDSIYNQTRIYTEIGQTQTSTRPSF